MTRVSISVPPHDCSSWPISAGDGAQLTIELQAATPAETSPPPPSTQAQPPPSDLPVFGGSAPRSIRTIVIDAGHGGDDTGVRGPGGNVEKDLVLSVAKRIKASIEGRLGIRVLLTREADGKIDADSRAAIANN